MSSGKNSVLTAGLGYTIGNILIRGIGILTLPMFSRIMSTEEFGVYNVFMSYDAILFVIVGFALHSSIRSANIEFKGQISEYTSSVSLIYLLSAAGLSLIALLLGDAGADLLGFEPIMLQILILHSLCNALLNLYNVKVSLEYSYKKYLLMAMINSVGSIAISVLLIFTVFRSNRAMGRIMGSTSVLVILAVAVLIIFYKNAKPKFNKKYWSFGLKYSLPIVPHGLSQMLLSQFDRIMISKMVGDSEAGIYSLAGNLKIIMTVITSSISAAWNTWFFEQMDKGDSSSIQKRAVQLGVLYTILAIGLMALSPELVFVLGGNAYRLATYAAIPMILDSLILFFYDLVSSGEYYLKKTVNIMLATMGAAVLNVILNVIFIQKYGFIAAAYTTLASYVVYLALHIIICRKMLKFFILPLKWMFAFCAVAVAMAAVDIAFINNLFVRWGLCAAVVIPMALLLIKSMGGIKALLGSVKKENSNG